MVEQFWHWGGRKVPMNSLLDLFLFISQDLKADYSVQKERKYRLDHGTLSIGLDIKVRDAHFYEKLDIHKNWEISGTEHVVYIMDYDEPTIAEAREREKMKAEPGGDWSYQAHLKMENRNRYLSNEMYADNISILNFPLCKIGYEASRIDRGLRSLAHLRFPEELDKNLEKWRAFPFLYKDMLGKTEWLLAGQLGSDRTLWKAALRKGKADINIAYAEEIRDVFAVWIIGRYLFDLCRVYGRVTKH